MFGLLCLLLKSVGVWFTLIFFKILLVNILKMLKIAVSLTHPRSSSSVWSMSIANENTKGHEIFLTLYIVSYIGIYSFLLWAHVTWLLTQNGVISPWRILFTSETLHFNHNILKELKVWEITPSWKTLKFIA